MNVCDKSPVHVFKKKSQEFKIHLCAHNFVTDLNAFLEVSKVFERKYMSVRDNNNYNCKVSWLG